MAIYHLTAKILSRSKGQSAVAASAYRSGEKIRDDVSNTTHDYTRKSGVEYSEIMTPEEAPEWVKNRESLWNAVEVSEKRKDSQVAREIEVALPAELTRDQQIELVRDFAAKNYVNNGMIADVNIHDKQDGNPHAHILLTTREILPDGFGRKKTGWNNRDLITQWRESWEIEANTALERAGREERIDRRSLEDQGIDREPQIHVGHSPHSRARNEEIKGGNERREALKLELREINAKYSELEAPDLDEVVEKGKIEPAVGRTVEQKETQGERYQRLTARMSEITKQQRRTAAEIAAPKLEALESKFIQTETERIKAENNEIYNKAMESFEAYKEHGKMEPERPWKAIIFRRAEVDWERKWDGWHKEQDKLLHEMTAKMSEAGIRVNTEEGQLEGRKEAQGRLTDEYAATEAIRRDYKLHCRYEVREILRAVDMEAWEPFGSEPENLRKEIREIETPPPPVPIPAQEGSRESKDIKAVIEPMSDQQRDNAMIALAGALVGVPAGQKAIRRSTDGVITGRVVSLIGEVPDSIAVIDKGVGKSFAVALVEDNDAREVLWGAKENKSAVTIRSVGGIAKEAKIVKQERKRGGMGR